MSANSHSASPDEPPDMRELKKRPYFREDAIDSAVEMGTNYVRKWWETDLEDYRNTYDVDRFEILEFWGNIDRTAAEEVPRSPCRPEECRHSAGQLLDLSQPSAPSRNQPVHAEAHPYFAANELNPTASSALVLLRT